MMRLPPFRYLAPKTPAEACRMLAAEGPDAAVVAGGTDLYPNMKRRHQRPKTLIGLRRVKALRGIAGGRIGAATLLADIERDAALRASHPAFWKAVRSISTPALRNMGTVGGNACLDTRCYYYNQTHEWRRGIHFCMKCDGETCWVAPSSDTCLAVSSSDTAPVLCALGAKLRLASAAGERVIEAKDLYRRDGIHYLTKRPDELLTEIELPEPDGWRATYWKLRRRGAIDFPVLGVAVRLGFEGDRVADARIWLGAVASSPIEAVESAKALVGQPLSDERIGEAANLAYRPAKPMENTDFYLHWRKEMVRHYVRGALEELRGDHVR